MKTEFQVNHLEDRIEIHVSFKLPDEQATIPS